MKALLQTLFLLGLLSTWGCGAPAFEAGSAVESAASEKAGSAEGAGLSVDGDVAEPSATPSGVERKIIYRADIDVVVEQFDPVPAKVQALAAQHRGYVAKSNVRGRPGSPRSGEWTIRVPVTNYESFLDAAVALGQTRGVRTDSDDVTAEFYDVEARIRNKRQEESRLQKHLEESTGKLEEILAVEREISRVRGEVERMEGRMRVLKDLTSLTTINLSVQEIRDYVPEGDPTYLTQVRRTFDRSLTALFDTAKSASLGIVATLPWLAVFALASLLVLLIRRITRRPSSSP